MKKNKPPNAPKRTAPQRPASLLRITFLSGLLLMLLIGGGLAGIFIRGGIVSGRGESENTFHRLMREYDFKSRQILESGSVTAQRRELERLDNDLNRLEKKAEGVESWLSVLKRRRQLANIDTRYEQPYRQSSRRAAHAFPYSEPIAAVAAAALIHNAAITGEGQAYLREVLPLLTSSRFAPMRLSLNVLLGDFNNPEKAAASLPRDFTLSDYSSVSTLEAEVIFPDLILLKIVAGEIPAAAVDIQAALTAYSSPALIRLAAEYFYDFGDLIRSAELFSMLPDEAAISRQADALWLAGYIENARAIWAMLAAMPAVMPATLSAAAEEAELPPQLKSTGVILDRALYNLALTAPTWEEETALFQRLIQYSTGEDPTRRFGLIRLSRLLEVTEALTVLNAEKGPADYLIDLEILKRRTEIGELPRMIAETWLLLGRYPETEDLYEWGVWYFNLQRNYTESANLLKIAARHNFTGYWMDLYEALQQICEGNIDAADKMLAAVSAESGYWAAAANWGRVLEALRAPARALENYEKAAVAVLGLDGIPAEENGWLTASQVTASRKTASRIQLRIAYCLKSMGRIEESRRALQYALDLNPDNLSARLELDRL
jgi:tetratricopeptide (TPR) repeat protein